MFEYKPEPIDIRDWKHKGLELHKEIENAVWETQRLVMRPLPDRLIMTLAQFKDLNKATNNVGNMQDTNLQDTQDRFYYTKHNIMEVQVEDK